MVIEKAVADRAAVVSHQATGFTDAIHVADGQAGTDAAARFCQADQAANYVACHRYVGKAVGKGGAVALHAHQAAR